MSRNILIFVIFVFVVSSCSLHSPKDFTYKYSPQSDTGLGRIIDINGYYTIQRECDSAFFSVFMFYPDGLFIIATGTDLSEVEKCFASNDRSTICSYPSWGLYQVEGDTIRTQTVMVEGEVTGITIFRDYLIQPDGSLTNLSDYVHPQNARVGYMRKYPSFRNNTCSSKSTFIPLSTRRDLQKCPFLKLKWFVGK